MPLKNTESRKTNPNTPCDVHNRPRCLADIIDDYAMARPPGSRKFDPIDCSDSILESARNVINSVNKSFAKGSSKWRIPDHMEPFMIARVVAIYYGVYNIHVNSKSTDSEAYVPGIYVTNGPEAGLYSTSEEVFKDLFAEFNPAITTDEFDDTMDVLSRIIPKRELTKDRHLVALNNGIFNYATKQLIPFSPDYVFIDKARTDFNPNAKNIVIHNDEDGTDWDAESWMNGLSDDPEVVNVLWQIIGASIRPNVMWDKSAWFYAETGNNGKGTLCELMRNLIGEGSYTSLPLSDMGKDFMLEDLVGRTAIICDENDVGTYIDKAANLKAIVTHDVVMVNRKFKRPIKYQFRGFMVQCLNEMPRIKDKSDSFFRRQLFIPFNKSYTGHVREYIKYDYLHRKEVLEYFVYRVLVLMPDYYQIEAPASCKAAQAEFRDYNDPVRQFIEEVIPLCKWDLLPFTFLYDLYRSWYDKYIPSGSPQARNTFIKDLCLALDDNCPFVCEDKATKYSTVSGRVATPEPLIKEYDLKDWYNKTYNGKSDIDRLCTPSDLNDSYRGLVRRGVAVSKA